MIVLFPRNNRTEVALFEGERNIFCGVLLHPAEDIRRLSFPVQEAKYRARALVDYLEGMQYPLNRVRSVFAPGGMCEVPSGGVYPVTEEMLRKLVSVEFGEHFLNLGAFIAQYVAETIDGCCAYVAEPAVQGEMIEEARITGFPEVRRRAVFHALSQRGAAWAYAEKDNKTPEDMNLIVVHLGVEISVGAHRKGRIIDVNSPLDGEGPFSSRLSGNLPVGGLVTLCYNPDYDFNDLLKKICRTGGLMSHLGTGDKQEILARYQEGDIEVKRILKAMAYNISKEIGRRAAALKGEIDAILLLGPWSDFTALTRLISQRVEWIAPVEIYPKLKTMDILASMGRRYLKEIGCVVG